MKGAVSLAPGLFAELHRRQPVLARLGWAMLGLLGVALLAMALDGRTLGGVSVWAKPAKFAASFVLWFWTLAWAWGVLAPEVRRGPVARLVLWGTVAGGVFEIGWITLRAALARPSHFATDPLGAFGYGLMGLAALALVALAAGLGVLVLCRGDPAQPRPWRLAVGLGLLLGGVLGGVAGATISVLGGPVVGAAPGGGVPFLGWSRVGGDLRVAHFLGTHAMQALPALVLAWPRAGAGLVGLAALGWAGLTVAAYAAARAGLPLVP